MSSTSSSSSSSSSVTTDLTADLRAFVKGMAKKEAAELDVFQQMVGDRVNEYLGRREFTPEMVAEMLKDTVPPKAQKRKEKECVILRDIGIIDVRQDLPKEFALFAKKSETDYTGLYYVSDVSTTRKSQDYVAVRRGLRTKLTLSLFVKRSKKDDSVLEFRMHRAISDEYRNKYKNAGTWERGRYCFSEKNPYILPLYSYPAQNYHTTSYEFKEDDPRIVDMVNNEVEKAYDAMARHIATGKCQKKVTMSNVAVTGDTPGSLLNVPALCGLRTRYGCTYCEKCENPKRSENVLKRVAELRADNGKRRRLC